MEDFPAHINGNENIQTVENHCHGVAQKASDFVKSIGLEYTAYLSGLMHDAGKCSEEFKKYIYTSSNGGTVQKGSIIHSFAAVRYFLKHYHTKANDEMDYLTSEILSISTGSHHGLFDCIDENSQSGFEHKIYKQPEYDETAIGNFMAHISSDVELKNLFEKSKQEIEKALSKIESISSSEEEAYFSLSLLARLVTSATVDADRTDTRLFMSNITASNNADNTDSIWQSCINNYNAYISSFAVETPIQKSRKFFSDRCFEASKKPTEIYRLDLPTGGGKTLSGLRFALNHAKIYHKSRIFFISPLLTILEQNAEQIRKAVGNDSIILEHHSDVVEERQSGEEFEQYEVLCETWESPIVITTLVQFLNTLFCGKMSSVRRFHSLSNSIIVIDEVQTIPLKMLSLFNSAINFLNKVCNATVVLCSATQPEFEEIKHPMLQGKDIIDKSELKQHEKTFRRNVIINKGRKTLAEIPEIISDLFGKNKSVLVICNKKSQSAEIYKNTEGMCENRYHLSAGMCIAHRRKVLDEIRDDLNNPDKKTLCISTQVIEAGVDISFDAVIRFSAGLDSIVQAAGRCNRNGENGSDSTVWIVDCTDENLALLKDIYDAKNATESLLFSFDKHPDLFDNDMASEKAISFYYSKLFMAKKEGYFDYMCQENNSIYSLLSTNPTYGCNECDGYLMRQAFKTAGILFEVFDQEQKSIIVPWGEGEKIISQLTSAYYCITQADINRIKPYTVSVFSFQFKLLEECGAIWRIDGKDLYVLDQNFYDKDIGVLTSKEGEKLCSTLIL